MNFIKENDLEMLSLVYCKKYEYGSSFTLTKFFESKIFQPRTVYVFLPSTETHAGVGEQRSSVQCCTG